VEVIKGSSSTLYGGGAIAGLVNLITKEPEKEREMSTLFNMSSALATDISAFYSEKYGKTGLTFYTAGNLQKEYDPNNDGFSDIPRFKRFTVNPNFFYYFDKNTTLNIGLNAGVETRKGGDMQVIKGNADSEHIYYEQNNSNRYSATAKFGKIYANKSVLTVKAAGGYFERVIERNDYNFDGRQFSGFAEGSYNIPKERTDWVFGFNAQTDDFKQSGNIPSDKKQDYSNTTLGGFAQNILNISPKLITESGLRLDYANNNHFFALPRLSLLYKINPQWSSRIGGGLGYKMPTIFSEDSEEKAFRNILPLDFKVLKPERSYGANADVNFKTTLFDELFFSINQMFFYTIIQKPLVLREADAFGFYAFDNADGRIDTKGFETNVKLRYGDISCFLGYTLTDAVRNFDDTKTVNPLTSKHRINANLMYEIDNKLRIAYELFYISPQNLTTNEQMRSYWIMGISAEYMIKYLSLFINFENFTDTRQSRWETMYTGSVQNPQFTEIYAPTDGFIANWGFRLRF
jgi:iron complex outermembrane receptor protein